MNLIQRVNGDSSTNARERSRADSRRRLLDAAVEEFAEKGFTKVRATDIAARAGVAVGTLYLHFGDKGGIARAVALDALEDLRARLRAAADRPDAPVEESARAHATVLVDFVAGPGQRGRLLFAGDSPGLHADALDAIAAAQEARLRERRHDGYFRADVDVAVAAQALVGMQARVLAWWIQNPRRASRRAVIDTLTKLRLSGIHDRGAESGRKRR